MGQEQLDSQQWVQLVDWLGGEALAASAREHRAFIRARGIKSALDLLRLVLMYGPGGYSLRSLAAVAAAQGIADVSDVSLLERFRNSAEWLQGICGEVLGRVAQSIDVGPTQRLIRIVDGSRLEGPGDRVWRLHLCYDHNSARIADAAITTTKEGERLDRLAVTPGEIRLADRGFPQPNGIKNTLAQGADVLVRLTWNSLQLTTQDGNPIEWLGLFKRARTSGPIDIPVYMHKAHSTFEPLPMRVVIIEKPPAAAAKACAKAKRASSKNQRRTDPRTLAAAHYVILLTSLKPEEFSTKALAALYRLRWQIELAFKRLKSILHIDRLPAKDPNLARAWLYAHLLFALILDSRAPNWTHFPPQASSKRVPSIWRTTVLLAQALIAIICPPLDLAAIGDILTARIRQLLEPPRRRRLQMCSPCPIS
jgi:hypothetical protein